MTVWGDGIRTTYAKLLLGFVLLLLTVMAGALGVTQDTSAETPTQLFFPIVFAPYESTFFGIAHDMVGEDPERLDDVIASMQAAGVGTVRMPFRWTLIEPKRDNYLWRRHDIVVEKLRAADIEIVGIFGTVPTWANGKSAENAPPDHDPTAYPPTDIDDFNDMVGDVVRRYKGDVAGWVIFNEPNIDKFWRPAPDAEQYVEFLCEGYRIVKRWDADATVIGGALAGNGQSIGRSGRDVHEFLPLLYEAGALGCYDVLAIHPYLHPTINSVEKLQASINETRALMDRVGDFRPIWLNEIGWSTAPDAWGLPTVSEAEVADWLTAVYTRISGVDRIYWYNFRDVGLDPLEVEFRFGLTEFDLTPKPAYDAFGALRKPTNSSE